MRKAPRNPALPDKALYCRHCGYPLEGLFGDPVRCPECAGRTRRSDAAWWGWPTLTRLHQFDAYFTKSLVAVVGFAVLILVLLEITE